MVKGNVRKKNEIGEVIKKCGREREVVIVWKRKERIEN
jgi:hypothetical protein